MNKIYRRIFETFLVLFGNFLYAFGIGMFILPGGLITDGNRAFYEPGGGDSGFRVRVWG